MKNTKRKGFTIVELVIVLAVIAILAAVLIPTFASLINKANRSADIQAVHQMNTQLAIDEVDSNKTIVDVYAALEEGGMTAKDYKALATGAYFFWDSELNRVLYTNDKYEVQYPEEYKDVTSKTEGHQWYSLSGTIEDKSVEPESDGTYKISSAAELYWIANQVTDKKITRDVKITLDSEKIDLMGADVTFKFDQNSGVKSFTLSGVTNGTKIVGLCQLSYNQTSQEKRKNYGCGLISVVDTGTGNGKVKISNITIEDSAIGDLEVGSAGALIGKISGAATDVTIENCKIENTVVYGRNKVGGLIGQISAGIINISECSLNKTTVNTSEGESGIVIGSFYAPANLTIDKGFGEWAKSCAMNLVDSKFDRTTFTASSVSATKFGDNSGVPAGTYFVEAKDQDGNYDDKYRMYVPGAYATVGYSSTTENTPRYVVFKVGNDTKIENASYTYGGSKKTYNNNTSLVPYTAITE